MPNVGSWNGKWSQAGELFIRTRRECDVPKKCWNKSFRYSFGDGWTACVTTERMPAKEAANLERKSRGFCGYDWMIKSIIQKGFIATED